MFKSKLGHFLYLQEKSRYLWRWCVWPYSRSQHYYVKVNFLFSFVDHEKPRGTGSKISESSLPKINHMNHTLNFLHPMPRTGLLITLDSRVPQKYITGLKVVLFWTCSQQLRAILEALAVIVYNYLFFFF